MTEPGADNAYVGRRVHGRRGSAAEAVRGKVTGTSEDRDGCRLHIRWADGRRTYPCAAAVRERDDGDLEIE